MTEEMKAKIAVFIGIGTGAFSFLYKLLKLTMQGELP